MRLFFLLLLLGNLAFFTWHFQMGAYSETGVSAEATVARTDPGVPGIVTIAERAQQTAAPAPRAARPPEPEAPVVAETPAAPSPSPEEPVAASPPSPVDPAPAVSSAPRDPATVRPPQTAPAAVAPPPPATAARVPERCTSAGPYENAEAAEAARRAAVAAGIDARVEETGRQVPAGFWVLLEGRYPIAEARRLLREMEGKGLRDIAITPLEDGSHAISLGIFSLQSTLDNRRREIIAQGYIPEVRERTRTINAYRLRLRLAAEDLRPMTRMMNTLVEMDPRIEWRDIDCLSGSE